MTGKLSDQLSIYGGYSFLDAEIVASTAGAVGNSPRSVPEHKASIFVDYTFNGRLEAWSLGMGLIHVGKRPGDNDNSFEIPGYERVDLTLGYQRDQYNFRVTCENLFDEDYLAGSIQASRMTQGQKRFITFTVGLDL